MFRGSAAAAGVVFWGASALGQLPAPIAHLDLPIPGNASTFLVTARYGSDGLLYVWDGSHIWREDAVNANGFTDISAPGTVGSGSADAGQINFTRDGTQIIVGNGAGGLLGGANTGLLFAIPATGGSTSAPVADVDYHVDFIPLPAAATLVGAGEKLLVEQGDASFSGSSVSIVDLVTGLNVPVIGGIPGAATSLVLDSSDRLYIGIGYGPDRGDVRRYDWPAVESAFDAGTPLNWLDGELFNPASTTNNSGSGMFFDSRGYLFVGGNEGLAVFGPEGVGRTYDIGPGYSTVVYNASTDEFLVMSWGENNGNVYSAAAFVPEPGLLLPAVGLAVLLHRRRPVSASNPRRQS